MKMKKITIASLAIGTMLSIAACSPSAEKDQVKKEQTNAQEEAKTTNADETSATKNGEKETNTSTNEKTEKDQKNSKESSGTENNAKTTEKETSTKTTDQATNEKTKAKDTNKSVTVKTNVKAVTQLIDSLDKQLAANPKLETVNKLGKQINEKWDVIEKELEANHPTDYKMIGQSMYPLIVAAEKEKIDVKRIKSLTTKTKQDLNQLLNKL
ncbi:hypothetical protein CN354_08790 [Bacillus cereus]|nr:hypothetical protein CN354_08790 [Bacillus cereus]